MKYEGNPPAHIRRAMDLISRATGGDESEKPTGVTTVSDVQKQERALARAQQELKEFSDQSEGMRPTLDKNGTTGLVIESIRFQKIETLQANVERRRQELTSAKRSWLAGILENH